MLRRLFRVEASRGNAGALSFGRTMAPYVAAGAAPGRQDAKSDGWLRRVARLAVRLGALTAILLGAFLQYALRQATQAHEMSPRQASLRLAYWSRLALRWLKVRVLVHGSPPRRGMLVSNRVGYLDILVFASIHPMVFVAGGDVRRWPLLGRLVRMSGGVVSQRGRRLEVSRLNFALTPLVVRGNVVAWFPEGSRRNGHQIGRFHSSLLTSAVARGWPITPASIRYTPLDASWEGDARYGGDKPFILQFLKFLTRKQLQVTVVFGRRLIPTTDHRACARELQSRVASLFQSSDPCGEGLEPTKPACPTPAGRSPFQ